MWAVFLPSLVSPFGVYLARIYAAASVPEALLEAARLDGASEFRAFFVIAVRLIKRDAPMQATVVIAAAGSFGAVVAMHADTTTLGFLHKGGNCGCHYIAGVILQAVMPVAPETDAQSVVHYVTEAGGMLHALPNGLDPEHPTSASGDEDEVTCEVCQAILAKGPEA